MSLDTLYYLIRDSMKIQNTDDVVFKLFQNLGIEWERVICDLWKEARAKKEIDFLRTGKENIRTKYHAIGATCTATLALMWEFLDLQDAHRKNV